MCVITEHIFSRCMHVYKTEILIRCPDYRWWGCNSEEEEIRISMPDRLCCQRCVSTWAAQVRREYVIREKKIIEDAETKHWSKETLSNARRKLNRAQRAEIRSLRDMGDSRVALAEPDRYANIEGPEIRS